MSYSVQNLTFPKTVKMPKKLSATFDESDRDAHAKAWAPLEACGVMPCDTGVQVYAQPKDPEQIRRLARALLRVAARLKNR